MKKFPSSLIVAVWIACVILCALLIVLCIPSRTDPTNTYASTDSTGLRANQTKIDWTMDAKIVDGQGKLITNGKATIQGIITKNYNAEDSIQFNICFQYPAQYSVWPNGMIGYNDLSHGNLAPYYIFSVHINDSIEKTSNRYAAALDADAECAIFCISDEPLRYLVASTDADVDIQEMLEHFRKYLEIRPYLNVK